MQSFVVAAIVVAAIMVEAIVAAAIMAGYAMVWCFTALYTMDTSDYAIMIMAGYPMSWCLTAIYAMGTNLELPDFACIPINACVGLIMLGTILRAIVVSRTTGKECTPVIIEPPHLLVVHSLPHQYLLPYTNT